MIRTEQRQLIDGFPNYEISDLGRVYNTKTEREMSVTYTNHGHAKISLIDWEGVRHTRSVALLVAQAFVEPPDLLCDSLIVLDGNFTNVKALNLAWRPIGYAWEYTHQLKKHLPLHYENLPLLNVVTGERYDSIREAGMAEGLLFHMIWRSTKIHCPVYPTESIFEVDRLRV